MASPAQAGFAPAGDLDILIDTDDEELVSVDPTTGATEIKTPDGGVIVNLEDARRARDLDEDDDPEQHYRNLAEEMDEGELNGIANTLIEAIEADDRSRNEWMQTRSRGIDLLALKLEDPKSGIGDTSAPIEGMSSVRNPLLLEAILRGWANATGELLPAEGPVKVRDDGSSAPALPPVAPGTDPDQVEAAAEVTRKSEQTEDDLAVALVKDMNHYLTVTASEYYPETQHMLLWGTHFGGSGFKKVYRCPMRRRPVSESVQPEHLIVSDATKDLKACERITHAITMRQSVMKRMKLCGAYRDLPETQPTPDRKSVVDDKFAMIEGINPTRERPEDEPYTVWEAQCELDIDEYAPAEFKDKGIPLPYIVTLDKDARQVLALRRDWDPDDENAMRDRMYVKYPYVPGPGFYGTGLLQILGNATAAMTAAWRLALDAGMFGSFPSFMYLKQLNHQLQNNMRAGPGQGIPFEAAGATNINNLVAPIPFRDVTGGLLSMMDKILQQAQRVGNVAELQVGEGRQDVPVGTTLAQIEQATKVMAAAHKGMHSAQAEEFQLLRKLFQRHPEDFWRYNDECSTDWDVEKLTKALNDCKLVPVADPNTPSQMHRLMRCVALKQLEAAAPQRYDGREVDTVILQAIGWNNPERFFVVPQASAPPPVDPARMLDAQAKMKSADVKAMEVAQKAKLQADQLRSDEAIEVMRLARELAVHPEAGGLAQQTLQQNMPPGRGPGGRVI